MQKKFDLNIENILEDWEIYHAVREIIANAIDEQLLTKTKEIEIFNDNQKNWHIRDFGRGLKYQHLTQKEDQEKLRNPELVIGKFGVGLKDALATFYRHEVNVFIKSKFGNITLEMSKKAEFDDIKTLHALVSEPEDDNFIGTEVILEGVNESDIKLAKEFFLKFSDEKILEKTQYGEVLKKGKDSAKIYINGLRVNTEENFLFAYNITSLTKTMRKALNRERTHVGRSAYSDRVKIILQNCTSQKVAEILIDDLKGFEKGNLHDELNWIDIAVHACRILNSKEKVIFLTPPELLIAKYMTDNAIKDGYKVISIPENVKKKIQGLKDLDNKPIRDLEEYKTEWNTSFKFNFIKFSQLDKNEQEIFEKTNEIFDLIGGKPKNIDKILISETMRLEKHGFREAAGLWQSPDIIIKRTELRSLSSFAGTFLHEVGHALSGKEDISEEFEQTLTNLLGMITKKAIENKNK